MKFNQKFVNKNKEEKNEQLKLFLLKIFSKLLQNYREIY